MLKIDANVEILRKTFQSAFGNTPLTPEKKDQLLVLGITLTFKEVWIQQKCEIQKRTQGSEDTRFGNLQ